MAIVYTCFFYGHLWSAQAFRGRFSHGGLRETQASMGFKGLEEVW